MKYPRNDEVRMRFVSGMILTDEGFIEGYVGFQDGVVIEIGKGKPQEAEVRGIVLPTLIDAHTHIADYRVPVDLSLSIEELVAPPNGLKHRMLRNTSDEALFAAMEEARGIMLRRGASQFIDFREGGEKGAALLKKCSGWPKPYVMGRPNNLCFDREEVDKVLEVADGIGVSSVSDWELEELKELAAYVHSRGRRFAIHASERIREDIDDILDLQPDFIVHMTMADIGDLQACASAGVPIVACPRSNLFFGRVPPLAAMLKAEVDVALGTDNAMFNLPDMLSEMEFAGRILRSQGIKDLSPVLSMALYNGQKLLMGKSTIGIRPGESCDFMVARWHQGDPVTDLVLRGSSSDPLMVCLGLNEWRGGT
ncbi:MAG: amidohydrolase family protein [Methanomassiliicoccales archaeon]